MCARPHTTLPVGLLPLALLALCLATLAACGRDSDELFGKNRRFSSLYRPKPPLPLNPPDTTDASASAQPVTYVTGIRFPKQSNWREGDLRGAEAVLWRNATEALAIPFSGTPTPERLFFRNGHLWMDETNGSQTLLSCDGAPRFTFDGEELVVGFLEKNGVVHTLGQRPDGQGIVYRCNGVVIYAHATGSALGSLEQWEWPGGALTEDGNNVYYSFRIPIHQGENLLWEHRVMRGAEVHQTLPAEEATIVYDLRVHGKTTYRAECRTGDLHTLSLTAENTPQTITLPSEETPRSCMLFPLEGSMALKGTSSLSSGRRQRMWIRDPEGTKRQKECTGEAIDLYIANESQFAFLSVLSGHLYQITLPEGTFPFPADDYSVHSGSCASLVEDMFFAALEPVSGNNHLIIHGSTADTVSFNGYFTSLHVVAKK